MQDTEEKFLFMADAHIKARTWTNSMQLVGDAYAALDKLQHSNSLTDVKTLVIGGDWFDNNRPTSTDLKRTREFLHQFKDIYFISGNHDNVTPSFLEIFDPLTSVSCIHRLNEEIIKLSNQDNVYIAGISWVHSAEDLKTRITGIADTFRTQYKQSDVLYLVLHTSFKHLLAFDGSYKLTQEFISDVCKDSNIRVLVGDIHTRNTTIYNESTQSYIHSPGSLYPLSFDKTSEAHAVSKVSVISGDIEDINTDVRMYSILQFTNRNDLSAYVADVISVDNAGVLKPFIRLVLPDGMEVQITDSDYPDVVLQVVNTSADREDAVRVLRNETYTISQAIEEELADDDPDINDLAQALYASDDPLAEIERWLNLWKIERIR